MFRVLTIIYYVIDECFFFTIFNNIKYAEAPIYSCSIASRPEKSLQNIHKNTHYRDYF